VVLSVVGVDLLVLCKFLLYPGLDGGAEEGKGGADVLAVVLPLA
jgi:hypothetical protein